MFHLIRFLGFRHALRHKVRTLLTLSGVALGVGLVIAIQTVNHSIIDSFKKMIEAIGGRTTLQISAGAAGVPEELWEKLEKAPNILYVTPVVQQVIRVPEMENASVLLMGIDFTGDEEFRDYKFSDDQYQVDDPLAFLNDPNAVLISEVFGKKFNKREGDIVTIKVPSGERKLTIRGFLKAEGPARAFGGNFMIMDVFAAQSLFSKEGLFDRFDLITSDQVKVKEALITTKEFLGNAFTVEIPRARGDSAQTLLSSFQLGLNMGGLIALSVALFLIYNTMQIAVTQRRREISIAKALGAKKNDIVRLFVGEAFCLGAIGSFLGVWLGLWMAKGLLATVSSAVSLHFLKVNPDGIDVDPKILLYGFLSGVGAAALASFAPARLAASVSPVEGLKFEGTTSMYRPSWKSIYSWLGYFFLLAAGVLYFFSSYQRSLYWGYGTQLLVILGMALLVPPLLVWIFERVKWIPQRYFPPAERLAFDQLPRQASRASVTLCAIMLGFAMVVEIDNYIFSFKNTVRLWVEQSIPADLFITSGSKLARLDSRPMPESLEKEFLTWPEVADVDKVRFVDIEIDGVSVPILSNSTEIYFKHVKREFIQGNKKEAIAHLLDENAVVVSKNFLLRFNKTFGNMFPIQTPKGFQDFKIVGVVEDYTSDRGLIIMSRKQFEKAFGDSMVDSFDLYLHDKSNTEEIRNRISNLSATTTSDMDLFVLTNEEMRTEVFRIIDETYKVIKVMEIVAVFVAVLGIINTILASILEKTRTLGVLRALGATRRQIIRLVVAEGAYLAIGGMALGIVLGFILTFIVLNSILPKATGWSFPLHVPYAHIFGVSLIGFLMAMAAAYFPARHASKLDIVKAIEYE